MDSFQFNDEEDTHLFLNPTFKEVDRTFLHTTERLRKYPDKTFLNIYCLTGWGINFRGQQAMIINEYDVVKEFYWMWPVEWQMRRLARLYHTTYMMAFCACNREAYHPRIHRGMSK